MAFVVRIAAAAVLGFAALAKARSPRAAAAALATFKISSRLRLPVAVAVGVVEAGLAFAVAAGSADAAYAAAGLVTLFAAIVAIALRLGARGAPCGCFGVRSRIGVHAIVRNLVLAAVLATAPSLPPGSPSRDGWLLAGIVVLFGCIGLLALALLALAREIGVLRLRLAGDSALDIADEGPPLGSRIDLAHRFDRNTTGTRFDLAIFSSDGCRLCQSLAPVVAAFRRDPLIAVEVFDEVRDADVWDDLRVPGSPFAVALDRDGAVRAKGTFNTYGQLESILAAAERRLEGAHA